MTEASLITLKTVSKSAVISVEFDLMDFLDCDMPTELICPAVIVDYEVARDGNVDIEGIDEQAVKQFLAVQTFNYCMKQMHDTIKNIDRALAEYKQSVVYPILKALEDLER